MTPESYSFINNQCIGLHTSIYYEHVVAFGVVFIIFPFNKHFDKENDEPVITKPHHWRRHFITLYIVKFVLFENENSTYLMK